VARFGEYVGVLRWVHGWVLAMIFAEEGLAEGTLSRSKFAGPRVASSTSKYQTDEGHFAPADTPLHSTYSPRTGRATAQVERIEHILAALPSSVPSKLPSVLQHRSFCIGSHTTGHTSEQLLLPASNAPSLAFLAASRICQNVASLLVRRLVIATPQLLLGSVYPVAIPSDTRRRYTTADSPYAGPQRHGLCQVRIIMIVP
jgi:hypothetical protein